MNTILLQPTDVLFFRDGRPMTGSLAGHGAAWPLPNVINAAFHAALHRGFPAQPEELNGPQATRHGDHVHRIVRMNQNGRREVRDDGRHRRFGSLVTAGPFPVKADRWFFPRPADLLGDSLTPALLPERTTNWKDTGSLPKPLCYAVDAPDSVSKDLHTKAWISQKAFEAYLGQVGGFSLSGHAVDDDEFCDTEHSIGIEIDPATGTAGQGVVTGKFYSAHYLRLRDAKDDHWHLGVMANCTKPEDAQVLNNLLTSDAHIIVGGQQRVCTARPGPASPALCLPRGLSRPQDFHVANGKTLVKWVLLGPAIWPEMTKGPSSRGTDRHNHPGGWLPNWIDPKTGAMLLRTVSPTERNHRRSLNAHGEGYRSEDGSESIGATLVAALVPKPIVVTGWSLADELAGEPGGAQSTHLAVPAGAIYFFEADSAEEARKLADAFNWHGTTAGTEIKNRRSTLLGEKGFGLGVCGTWTFLEDAIGHSIHRNL